MACPECGGRLRLLATIEDRAVVETVLAHLGLPVDLPQPSPARTPAWLPGVREAADEEHAAGGHWSDCPPQRRATSFQAAESYWRRNAAPEPVPDHPLSGVFGRLTRAGGLFHRRGRGGVRGNDPFGPRRCGSDKGRSVNNPSLSGLSARVLLVLLAQELRAIRLLERADVQTFEALCGLLRRQ